MAEAVNNVESKYGIEKKVLSKHSKLYCQKTWNTSVWMEIPNTATFHRFFNESTKELSVRLTFRSAKSGFEFMEEDKFEEYVDVVEGDAIVFSQNLDGQSPYENKMGTVLREGTWQNLGKIAELIQLMYTDEDGKLFYGFTKQHANSFYRIISINLSTNKDASPFLPYLTNKVDTPPAEEEIDKCILTVYNNYHSSDLFGIQPQLNKFPPTNESMCRIPPNYNEWKSTTSTLITPMHQPQRNINLQNIQHSNIQFNNSNTNSLSGSDNNVKGDKDNEIAVIKFVRDDDEVCVIIEAPLDDTSTLSNVMHHEDVSRTRVDGRRSDGRRRFILYTYLHFLFE